MSDRQVRDEVLIVFLAGHETTANALAWTWYLLAQHPGVEAPLHAEIDGVLAGRVPTLEDVPRLPYTRNVIEEAIRLYPPAYVIDRQLQRDFATGGYRLRRGATAFLSPYLMHRDPRYYPDPDRFDPDRWAPGEREKRPKFAYFPFGAGPRICIGEQFAWTEAILVLATLAQGWRAELAPGANVVPYPLIVLRPKHGIPMQLHRR
jgi:cytochrome P450